MDKIKLIDVNKASRDPGKKHLLIPQKRKPMSWKARIAILMAAALFIGAGSVLWILRNLPSIESLKNYRPPVITEVFDMNGEKVGEFFKERRIVTPLEDIPLLLRQAFVASEDDKFYEHKGLDYAGIARAFFKNIMAGEVRQGGSTITQQVAKSLLLSPEKKISRKIREAVLAFRMERNLTKEHILFLYLNQVYLGHGAYGVKCAAQNYYDKELDELTLAEISILAGLVQAPSRYNPYTHLDRAKKRQRYVLEKMFQNHFISQEQMQEAFDEEIEFKDRKRYNREYAPYFTENIRRYLVDKYSNQVVLNEGLKVYSTVDIKMQKAAQDALRWGLKEIDKRQGYRGPLENKTGEEIEAFREILIEENTPENIEKTGYLKAIVIEVDDKRNLVRISTGPEYGTILLEDMNWARKPDPEVRFDRAYITKPSSALKVGDVILVNRYKPDELPERFKKSKEDLSPFFKLDQEPEVEGAVVAMDVKTGQIRAMVGGYDYERSEFNRATQAMRQPGSAFKPVIYSTAIDNGYSAASMIVDAPVIYDDPLEEKAWKPKNYGGRFYGKTIFRDALIKSRNILTIKILQDIGIDTVIEYARKLGVISPLTRDNTLALGSSVLSPLELIKVYAVFASGGRRVPPIFISRIEDRESKVREENIIEPSILPQPQLTDSDTSAEQEEQPITTLTPTPQPTEQTPSEDEENEGNKKHYLPDGVISMETAYIMTHLLKEVVHFGTGRRVRALGRPVAGKTGTTNDNIDAWFMGYTPDLVTGVWVGFDEKKPLGKSETGSRAAAPIWLKFMQEALKDTPSTDFKVPEGIVFVQIDPKTGKLASDNMQSGIFEAFIEGTQPTELSNKEKDSQIKNFFIEQ